MRHSGYDYSYTQLRSNSKNYVFGEPVSFALCLKLMSKGHDFYDKDNAFKIYQEHRSRQENPNNTLERPVIYDLLGDVKDKNILDLGCGDAAFGVER